MPKHVTISALLKSVIGVVATCAVAVLIAVAYDAWGQLNIRWSYDHRCGHVGAVVKAMHNLRTDRANIRAA